MSTSSWALIRAEWRATNLFWVPIKSRTTRGRDRRERVIDREREIDVQYLFVCMSDVVSMCSTSTKDSFWNIWPDTKYIHYWCQLRHGVCHWPDLNIPIIDVNRLIVSCRWPHNECITIILYHVPFHRFHVTEFEQNRIPKSKGHSTSQTCPLLLVKDSWNVRGPRSG